MSLLKLLYRFCKIPANIKSQNLASRDKTLFQNKENPILEMHFGRFVTSKNMAIATLEDVKNASKTKTLIIDVRDPSELMGTGEIPGSINIPLSYFVIELALCPDEFKKRHGVPKPDCNDPIIFSCKTGKRSAKAYEVAEYLGFKNIRNFEGGWVRWEAENSKL